MAVAYLDLSVAFGTVSHCILVKKLMKYRLDSENLRTG